MLRGRAKPVGAEERGEGVGRRFETGVQAACRRVCLHEERWREGQSWAREAVE